MIKILLMRSQPLFQNTVILKKLGIAKFADIMKTIHCAHPPHHHNGFVATCRLWTASGGVHALLLLEPTECSTLFYDVTDYQGTSQTPLLRGLVKNFSKTEKVKYLQLIFCLQETLKSYMKLWEYLIMKLN